MTEAPSSLCLAGSSPLARGTPDFGSGGFQNLGLIPARAGNTGTRRILHPQIRAHPRSRGEHYWCLLLKLPSSGSSPLARGTQKRFCPTTICRGLIPARAGNTSPINVTPLPCWAHPRSRGEHAMTSTQMTSLMGSSPLARGTRPALRCAALCRGLIPARAGNTLISTSHSAGNRAHPRSRGEHQNLLHLVHNFLGSSPLARGTLCWFP